jgi:hypothetical protein
MRLFLAVVIGLAAVALDRAFMDGKNFAFVSARAGRAAAAINHWADDLVGRLSR